jgi:hypothetical protein
MIKARLLALAQADRWKPFACYYIMLFQNALFVTFFPGTTFLERAPIHTVPCGLRDGMNLLERYIRFQQYTHCLFRLHLLQ